MTPPNEYVTCAENIRLSLSRQVKPQSVQNYHSWTKKELLWVSNTALITSSIGIICQKGLTKHHTLTLLLGKQIVLDCCISCDVILNDPSHDSSS